MEKLKISDLVIEITRKCNMVCDHCLRGNSQKKDIDFKHIDILLDKIKQIGSITFTGGEPSLNPEAIEYFVDACEKRNISVDTFYIATNAKTVTQKFLSVIMKLYMFCDYKEYCNISISNDQFHERNKSNIELLKMFRFVADRYKTEKSDEKAYSRSSDLINQGLYAINYNNGSDIKISPLYLEFDNDDNEVEQMIYLNCKGNIINGCDWSYKNQDSPRRIICNVEDFGIKALFEYNQKQFKEEYA